MRPAFIAQFAPFALALPLAACSGGGGASVPGGTTIVIGGGYLNDPTKVTSNPGGTIYGLSRSGSVLWRVTANYPPSGYVAITNGVAFTPLNQTLSALDLATGATLWSYALGSATYASAAVVPSGVYIADDNGDVLALSLAAPAPLARSRALRSAGR